MRCKNCGWPNKPNEKVCVKCHTPLEADNDDVTYGAGMPNNTGSESRPLNKTVMEDDIFGSGRNAEVRRETTRDEPQTDNSKQCPKCGYPVRSGVERCPNCNFSLSRTSTEPERPSKEMPSNGRGDEPGRRPTRMNNQNNKTGYGGTVNPYMMNLEMEPTFVLKPLKRMNERHELEEQEYEGSEVLLNRANTEENNPSITSREQAVVTRVDGRWYIEDRSEQKTTFVQAAKKIELHEGDIILLGNRLFEFHE